MTIRKTFGMTVLAASLLSPSVFAAGKTAKAAPKADAAPAAAAPPTKDDSKAETKAVKKELKAAKVSKYPEFDGLVTHWAELKKDGKLDGAEAKSLAGKFSSAAKGEVAALAHFQRRHAL